LFSNEGGIQKVISGNELQIRDPVIGDEDASLIKVAVPNRGCGGGSGGSSRSSMVQHHSASTDATTTSSSGTDAQLFPAKITKKGNYGYQVEWADGTTTIYSLLAISKAAGGKTIDRRIN
jgi:hypothetical protein